MYNSINFIGASSRNQNKIREGWEKVYDNRILFTFKQYLIFSFFKISSYAKTVFVQYVVGLFKTFLKSTR